MKKQVMVNAWSIARAAAAKFGGKVREYLAKSLRIAWDEAKATTHSNRIIVTMDRNSNTCDVEYESNGIIGIRKPGLNKTSYNSVCQNWLSYYTVRVITYYEVFNGVKTFKGTKKFS